MERNIYLKRAARSHLELKDKTEAVMTEHSANNVWNYNGTNGNMNANNKNNVNNVRPVTEFRTILFVSI